jgi:hypothetical protein
MQLSGHLLTLRYILFVLQEQYTAQVFASKLLVPSSEEIQALPLSINTNENSKILSNRF